MLQFFDQSAWAWVGLDRFAPLCNGTPHVLLKSLRHTRGLPQLDFLREQCDPRDEPVGHHDGLPTTINLAVKAPIREVRNVLPHTLIDSRQLVGHLKGVPFASRKPILGDRVCRLAKILALAPYEVLQRADTDGKRSESGSV